MKDIGQSGIILFLSLVGALLNRFILLSAVKETGDFLVSIVQLMFIPAVVPLYLLPFANHLKKKKTIGGNFMGLLDKIKKKKNAAPPSAPEPAEDSEAPGWDAITAAFDRLYPGQTNPKHYFTLIKWRFGGEDPLDGISVYDGGDYWHFVTYGFSELYEKETDDKEYSGYGIELTFKLKKDNYAKEEDEIRCICGILQQLARITFTRNELFLPFEYIYTRQTQGIDVENRSNITGFITVPEPKLEKIDPPNGLVLFVSLVGATDAELYSIYSKQTSVKELYQKLGSDVTDYHRQSVL